LHEIALDVSYVRVTLVIIESKKTKNFYVLTSQITRSNKGYRDYLILSTFHDVPAKPIK